MIEFFNINYDTSVISKCYGFW